MWVFRYLFGAYATDLLPSTVWWYGDDRHIYNIGLFIRIIFRLLPRVTNRFFSRTVRSKINICTSIGGMLLFDWIEELAFATRNANVRIYSYVVMSSSSKFIVRTRIGISKFFTRTNSSWPTLIIGIDQPRTSHVLKMIW